MTTHTVLIVDDSATARALLSRIIDTDPRLEVVGTARDGAEAVRLTSQLRPSVIVMDIEMPVLDGLEATRQIMATQPTPIVIVTAGYDTGRVGVSLQAIKAGALTVLPKPAGPKTNSFHVDAAQLVRLVIALADVKVVRQRIPQDAAPAVERAPRSRARPPLHAVGIAASTGGPAILQRLLCLLPSSFGAPVLIVQHIADGFVDGLAAWLRPASTLPVEVARDGRPAEPGHVYLAPDDRHLVLDDGRLCLSPAPVVGGFRPSADMLFRSLAQTHAAAAAAVVLTGMGKDGLDGAAQVHAAGGLVLAQDEATSAVWGMPGVVARAGLAHLVGPVDALVHTLSVSTPTRGRPR